MRLLLIATTLLWAIAAEQPASALRSGMRLIYESGGQRAAWQIDSIKVDSVSHCGRVWLRRDTVAEDRSDCVSDGGLRRWNARAGRWIEQRPILADSKRRYPRPSGWVEFVTGAVEVDTISGRVFPVVSTTVTTFDSGGVAQRRLRERYSIGLSTATWGVFESRDGTGSNGWRVTQEFRLVAIE
jgi:hypothetical protein